MITAGIDCGAGDTKTVILKDGVIIGRGKAPTGFDPGRAVEEALRLAIQEAGVARGDVRRIHATGSGREAVALADRAVSDIDAMARGAVFFFPKARTVADVGAEEGRAAKLDEKGNPVDFAVNEKCAAGAGAFIAAMARALDVAIEEMGPLALQSDKAAAMNAQCVIFAESEVVGLIHSGASKEDISKAIHDSIAGRVVSAIRRIGVNAEVVLIGGLAHNPGFRAALTRQLGIEKLRVPESPEFGAAVGAALSASEDPN